MLHRQDAEGEIGRRALDQQIKAAPVEDGVDSHRQMRAVLLHRGDRQYRDRLFRVDVGVFGRRVVRPPDLASHHTLPAGPAAMTSTSTVNSGRAKPETIISVEAGNGGLNRLLRTSMYGRRCSRPDTYALIRTTCSSPSPDSARIAARLSKQRSACSAVVTGTAPSLVIPYCPEQTTSFWPAGTSTPLL